MNLDLQKQVAEACGWTDVQIVESPHASTQVRGFPPDNKFVRGTVPDFPSSLDAIVPVVEAAGYAVATDSESKADVRGHHVMLFGPFDATKPDAGGELKGDGYSLTSLAEAYCLAFLAAVQRAEK